MNFLDKVNLVFLWVERNFTRPVFGRPIVFGIILVFLFIGLSMALTVFIVKHIRAKAETKDAREQKQLALEKLKIANDCVDKQRKTINNQKEIIERQETELNKLKKPVSKKKRAKDRVEK